MVAGACPKLAYELNCTSLCTYTYLDLKKKTYAHVHVHVLTQKLQRWPSRILVRRGDGGQEGILGTEHCPGHIVCSLWDGGGGGGGGGGLVGGT